MECPDLAVPVEASEPSNLAAGLSASLPAAAESVPSTFDMSPSASRLASAAKASDGGSADDAGGEEAAAALVGAVAAEVEVGAAFAGGCVAASDPLGRTVLIERELWRGSRTTALSLAWPPSVFREPGLDTGTGTGRGRGDGDAVGEYSLAACILAARSDWSNSRARFSLWTWLWAWWRL